MPSMPQNPPARNASTRYIAIKPPIHFEKEFEFSIQTENIVS
jgi:hypothetical protein